LASPRTGESSRASDKALERVWFRNLFEVLRRPRAVFGALRDGPDKAFAARQEPILALVFLAGIAAVINFSTTTRELLDDPAVDGALVPVLIFLGGGIYGFAGYWIGGLALHAGVQGAKGEGTFRSARHVLGYALAPLAVSLALWPIRLAVFGGDSFRTGGSDEGAGYWAFTALALVFLVWSLGLLVLGVREVHGWTVVRALGALSLTMLVLLGFAVLALAVGAG
jgi:hypothetical protein